VVFGKSLSCCVVICGVGDEVIKILGWLEVNFAHLPVNLKNFKNFEILSLWLMCFFAWVALEVFGHSATALTNTAQVKKLSFANL
jgi:hypothetical protein